MVRITNAYKGAMGVLLVVVMAVIIAAIMFLIFSGQLNFISSVSLYLGGLMTKAIKLP